MLNTGPYHKTLDEYSGVPSGDLEYMHEVVLHDEDGFPALMSVGKTERFSTPLRDNIHLNSMGGGIIT